MCDEKKSINHFAIEFIDRILINNEKYEKIIYSTTCNLCKTQYENKLNDYVQYKKITEVKDPEVKKLFIEFDDYEYE